MFAIKYTRIPIKAVKTSNRSRYSYIQLSICIKPECKPRRSPDTGHEPPPPGADAGHQKESSAFTALNNLYLRPGASPGRTQKNRRQ